MPISWWESDSPWPHKLENNKCPLQNILFYKDLIQNVDNYVGNVYKGHFYYCLLWYFYQNSFINKDISVKDIKISSKFHVKHVTYETYKIAALLRFTAM